MPSDSVSESETLAESTEVEEIGGPSESLQVAGDGSDVKARIEVVGEVCVENIEDRSSVRFDISEASGILEKDATSTDRNQSESLQDVEKLESKGGPVEEIRDRSSGGGDIGEGSEFVEKDVASVAKNQNESSCESEMREDILVESNIGHETIDGQRGSSNVHVASIEVVQVEAVEIHNVAEVVDKDVSCSERREGMMNDEIAYNSSENVDQDQAVVAVVDTVVSQEDIGKGISVEVKQDLQSQVTVLEDKMADESIMDHGCDHKDSFSQNQNVEEERNVALDSVYVDVSVKLLDADAAKDMNPVGPVEEDKVNDLVDGSMMCNDQEASVSHASSVGNDQNICEGKLNDETTRNSLDGHVLVAEIGDQDQEKVAAESAAVQEDIGEETSLEVIQAPELEVVGSEGEMVDGLVMIHGCDHKHSISKATSDDADQTSYVAGGTAVESVSVDSIKLQEADVGKDSNADDPVKEERLKVAESVNEDESRICNDEEDSVAHISSMDIDQNICDEGKEAEVQVSMVDNDQNIQQKGNATLESSPVDVIISDREVGCAEMSIDGVIDGNQGKVQEAHIPETSLTGTEQMVRDESDIILVPGLVDSTALQEDSVEKDTNPDVPVRETRSELMDEKTECANAIKYSVDDDQGNDPEASAPEASFEKTDQSVQEESEHILKPNLVESITNQADSVLESMDFTVPAAETEVGDESVMNGGEGKDRKVSISEISLTEPNQQIQGDLDTPLTSVHVADTTNEQAGHVEAPKLADLDIEIQLQIALNETVVGDGCQLHAGKETDCNSVSQTSFMEEHGTGNRASSSKISLVDNDQNNPEDHIIEAPIVADHVILTLADQVIEAPNVVVHVIEAPNLVDQAVEAPNLADCDKETPTLADQVIEAPDPSDAVLELQPQIAINEAVVGDDSLLDVDKETYYNASVSHTSFVENQGTGNESFVLKSSLADNDQNIPKESDAILNSILVDCTTDHQLHNVEESPIVSDTAVDEQHWISGRETEVNAVRNVDQNKDQEASPFQMPFMDTNENIQQEADNSALDFVILDGTLNHEENIVTEGLNPINSVEEQFQVIRAETKVGDGSIVDFDLDGNHEGSQSNMSLMGTDQDIKEESKTLSNSVCSDDTISHPVDDTAKDLNPTNVVVESIPEVDADQEVLGSVDVGNVDAKESNDGRQMVQVGEEKSSKKTMKKMVQSMAAICDQHVSYHLPLDKANFSFSDLVWGKVKSHPWWPGQIFDPSDASKLAMKYQKKDSFLVAYYGDKTFAWCDESQLKPFHSYFSQMEKLCSSDTFVKAVHDILMEVSRRVDLGMACSCLPEEDYMEIKHQKCENAGIRGGIINSIIDKPTVVNYFQPDKLLEYIETLAQFPNGRVDRLEFLIAQSQLKAFYRSKGYRELPVFIAGGGLIESVDENSLPSGKESKEYIVEHCAPTPPKGGESSINKREHGCKGDGKRKNTSKLSEAVRIVNGGENKSVAKAAEKSILSFSGKKHIVVELDSVDSGRCKKRMLDSVGDMELKSPAPTVTRSFKIGDFIRRAASQLTGASPILKCQGETPMKHDSADFDVLTGSPVENQKTNLSFTEDYDSTDEMLSQLCLAAKDPMNEYNFMSPVVAFFTEFRDFCVSSSSEDKEHVEKRKRGRPRKVISQQTSSDTSLSEDEKHAEKRKRGMRMKNIISQLASSDFSSEDEKPVEKRKRGRPRKNPKPASSNSSEDKKPIHKLQRDIPNKVSSQMAPNEKRKRGRPRKVHPDTVLSSMSMPDHTKDAYWSDMDIQKERNNKNLILKQYKRRKLTGEKSLSHPSTSLSYTEQQLQLVTMNPNMKHSFVAERSIISVDEKIVDECMPTALILSFNNANSLPSETDLIRIFSRYGPLKEAETDILRKTNRAKVVFKRRVDADTAFSSAGKYSIFGPGLLSYQLKPWTPKSLLQSMPQGAQDVTPVATPQENHDAEPIATPQGNQDAALIAAPQDMHESVPITTPLDDHCLAPITIAEGSHDAASIVTHDKCNAKPTVWDNLELSEKEEVHILEKEEVMLASDPGEVEAEHIESSPLGKHDVGLIDTLQEQQDEEPGTSPLDEHDLSPNFIQGNAQSIITLQDRCHAELTEGSNVELSGAMVSSDNIDVQTEGKESSPQDKHDPSLITAPQENQDEIPVALPQENHDAAPLVTSQEKCNKGSTVQSSLEISEQAEHTMEVRAEGNESTPQDKHDPDNQDEELVISPLGQHNLIPTITHDNFDATSITTLKEKCDEAPTLGSNLELSEQADAVIVSDMMEVEAEGGESLPQDAPGQDKQDEPVTSPPNEHDMTSTTRQDNLDPASAITQQDKCVGGPTVETDLEFSGQKEALVASDTMEVEAQDKEVSPQDKHNQENEHEELISSLLEERDLVPSATQDNLETSLISMPQDKHGAAFTEGSDLQVSEQSKSRMTSETVQVEAEGSNLEVSEQAELGSASDIMQVDGKESSE